MGEKVPQTLKNHTRFDPLYHFFTIAAIVVVLDLERGASGAASKP